MKQIKKLLITGFFLLFVTGNILASSDFFKEYNENWLQPQSAESVPWIPGGENPPTDPDVNAPIGDALPVLILLAGSYLIYIRFITVYKNQTSKKI
jgi:hypothetical protein